ncbi:LysR family transcriptional regulator [Kosakonia sp. H02]|nr:LysR family transcriptional regulator [Kosakonia sp. H02]
MFVTKALKVFITLYQEKNLKSAADRLCLTVPPVARMLKLTEEWLGEQLFISERNRLIPTQVADCVYQQLYTHYCALEQFNGKHKASFRISSPHAGRSIMANLLALCPKKLTERISVRYAGSMHPADDIFISLYPCVQLPRFEMHRTDMVLELQCVESVWEHWRDIPVLSEQSLERLPQFKRVMEELSKCGHNGSTRRVDNSVWLNDAFEHGEGLYFRRPQNGTGGYRALPFVIHLPLYIYINGVKKDAQHERFITNLKNETL